MYNIKGYMDRFSKGIQKVRERKWVLKKSNNARENKSYGNMHAVIEKIQYKHTMLLDNKNNAKERWLAKNAYIVQ